MSFSLTSNFLANSRGLTFEDGGGITWGFNSNTNEITAAGGGGQGNVLSSVGLTDDSSTAIYTVGNSPLTSNGALTITLKNQSANTVLAGPSTGSATQPEFRSLAIADLPTGIPNANLADSAVTVTAGTGLSGGGAVSLGSSVTLSNAGVTSAVAGTNITVSGATGAVTIGCSLSAANPSGTIGLSAANGSATTFMRSDGAPALSQAITPTWTGSHTFTNAGAAIVVQGNASYIAIKNGTPSSVMFLTTVNGWTNNSDYIDAAIAAGNALYFYAEGSTTASLKLTANAAFSGAIGVNGASPSSQSTGWGTPTGASVENNFNGSSATLAECTAAVAEIITVLQAIGFLGT